MARSFPKMAVPQTTATAALNRFLDVAMRVLPAAALVAVGAFLAASQAVRPNHRAIKFVVLLGLMVFMLRVDMVYSVYLFTVMFSFPSGISIASSNIVLMTVLPMVWAIRAASTKTSYFVRTRLDAPHGAFMLAYALSFINVESNSDLVKGLTVVWRQLTCLAYFYLVVRFVDDVPKFERLIKTMCFACGLVMLTAVVELIRPGMVLIPGWIDMSRRFEEVGGLYSIRLEKLRVGGAFSSDGNLSDFGSQLFCFMAYFAWKARNPIEKLIWSSAFVMTLVAILSSGNRGGLIGITIATAYGLYLFRKRLAPAQLALTVAAIATMTVVASALLQQYTYAVSPIDRLMNTEMHGVVPETRTMTWWPSIQKSLEHPFVGHGPYFEIGKGLTFQFWPHNGYLFYLQTLGLFGLGSFLWIMVRAGRATAVFRSKAIQNTRISDLMALVHVWFVVFAIEQLRTDHQRDDIYPYLVWLLFAIAVSGQRLAKAAAVERAQSA